MLAAPFLIVRNVYSLIEVISDETIEGTWSPVYGNAVAFALMVLLMEYVAICIWLYTGYTMPPDRGVRAVEQEQTAKPNGDEYTAV